LLALEEEADKEGEKEEKDQEGKVVRFS